MASNGAVSRGKQRQPTAEESAAQRDFGRKLAVDMGKPSNEPELKVEGQGLSKKQVADLERLVERARQWVDQTGRKYEDPDFPPVDASLYGRTPPEQLSEMPQPGEVGEWRRPAEFAPSTPMLMKQTWTVENIRQGAVDNRWLISSINILSTNVDQLMRAFLDPTKAAKGGRVDESAKEVSMVHDFGQQYGFYVCRFYEDDPASDDDWVVVLVDDRLPLSSLDGRPCFASHPDPSVYWGMILEKAAAKLAGSYAQLRGGTVKQGLKLLTGGRVPEPPRLGTPEGRALIPPSSTPHALWNIIMEKNKTDHVVGCSHAAKEDAQLGADERAAVDELERMGLVARRAYAVVACGETMGFKLLKLRLALAPAAEEARRGDKPSEWIGRFSDDSGDWSSQLRQMLSYSRDANDNTFWMMYEDFCKYFNKVYFCRMADDIWTKFVVHSRWMDETAGGSPAYLSWRANTQWLLRVEARPVQLLITLSQADARKASGHGRGYATAIGLHVVRGNAPADARRRKLFVGRDDVVAQAGPRFAQQVMLEITLEPSPRPYVLVPCAHAPGIEGAFKLVVQADDVNDDGKPDFGLVPVREEDDWHTTVVHNAWVAGKTAGGGPPTAASWVENPQYQLKLSTRARVFVFVELVDVDTDGRDEEGMQDEPNYPEIGLVVADGTADHVKLDGPPHVLREAAPKKAAGVFVELELDGRSGTDDEPPAVIVPYTLAPGVEHKFQLTVYSDVEHTLELIEGRGPGAPDEACEWCHAPAVIYKVLAKIDELEAKSEKLRMLEQRFVDAARYCYDQRDVDCGPGWDAWNRQKAELDSALLQLGGRAALAVAAAPPKAGNAHTEYSAVLASVEDDVRRSLRDCPDVEVDLRNMRFTLRRMVGFVGGRDVFAEPAVDQALLEQVARAVGACNALLHERGRAPLQLAVEGFVSSNVPCHLPCCRDYQNAREGAPNCALPRARAQRCKEVLASRLAELDRTGHVHSANAAAALIATRGHRFSRASALPGYDDGRNHPQNRRVEMLVLAPVEAERRAREHPDEYRTAAPPPPQPQPQPVVQAPTAATPDPTPPHSQEEPLTAEMALRQDLQGVEAAALQAVGTECPNVSLRARDCYIALGRYPRFVPSSPRFADVAAEDDTLSQVARLIKAIDDLLRRRARPRLLVAVEAFAPAHDVDGESLSTARADECARLLGARLAQQGYEGFAGDRPERVVSLGYRKIVPLPRDEHTGAQPVSIEVRLVTADEFAALARARSEHDSATARSAAERAAAAQEEEARRAREAAPTPPMQSAVSVAPPPPAPPHPPPVAAPVAAPAAAGASKPKRKNRSRMCTIV